MAAEDGWVAKDGRGASTVTSKYDMNYEVYRQKFSGSIPALQGRQPCARWGDLGVVVEFNVNMRGRPEKQTASRQGRKGAYIIRVKDQLPNSDTTLSPSYSK